jgi:hypothetical protein
MNKENPWEDSLLERKTASYSEEDYLKTFVAFANSVRPGDVAIVLLGEDDEGNAKGIGDADRFQIKIRRIIDKIYPAIVWHSELYEKDGLQCLRVEIRSSGNTPHFGGIAWIRNGSESNKAPDEVFQKLIELRLDKVYELSKWLGKSVSVIGDNSSVDWGNSQGVGFEMVWTSFNPSVLEDVNSFWVTLKNSSGEIRTISSRKFYLDFDNSNQRLKLCVIFSGIIDN